MVAGLLKSNVNRNPKIFADEIKIFLTKSAKKMRSFLQKKVVQNREKLLIFHHEKARHIFGTN